MGNLSDFASNLRRLAEDIVRERASRMPELKNGNSPEEVQRLIHELQVHQVELEMQNEELRRAQEEMASSRAKYFDLYDLAPVGYVTISEKGKILEANFTVVSMLDKCRVDVVGQHFSRFVIPEDQDTYYMQCRKLFENGEPREWNLRVRRSDGVVAWVHMIASLSTTPGGEHVCRAVINDTSSLKFIEEEREMTEKLVRIINTPCKFREQMADLTAALKDWSRCEAVGIRLRSGDDFPYFETCGFPNSFVEKENSLCIRDETGENARDAEGNAILECMCGNVLCGRFDPLKPFFTPKGSFWTNSTSVLLSSTFEADRGRTRNRCNAQGYESVALIPLRAGREIFGLIQFSDHRLHMFNRDIIDHFERMADCLAIALARRSAEESRDRLEDQLLQAQKMESIGRLAGGVAHDFNNMLGVILGHADMAINRTESGNPILADLEEIRSAARRSADLTRQLLAFARKQAIFPRVIDLNRAVEGVLGVLRRLIGEEVELIWVPGSNPGAIKADPMQIDQILTNLCINSSDAIEEKGRIVIETGNASFDASSCPRCPGAFQGNFVYLRVSDNGHGIAPERINQVFEPFFTTKELGCGTGLGLSTVLGIAEQNHGFVEPRSVVGEGTSFSIYFPRYDAEDEGEAPKLKEFQALQGKETILVVEDEPSFLGMTSSMLAEFGYTVLAAGTAEEAAGMVEAHADDIRLLITDVIMPGTNGRDLSAQLLARIPRLKCMFMSGYPAEVISRRGVLEEGTNFIQKPFSDRQLALKVREVLDS